MPSQQEWTPAEFDESDAPIFSEWMVVQLCLARLAEIEHEAVAKNRALALENLRHVLSRPELRLAYELVPEIIAERLLGTIAEPNSHQYALFGSDHAYDIRTHPVYASVLSMLESGSIRHDALVALAKGSAYSDAVSDALNKGSKLEDMAVCCVPLGVEVKGSALVLADDR